MLNYMLCKRHITQLDCRCQIAHGIGGADQFESRFCQFSSEDTVGVPQVSRMFSNGKNFRRPVLRSQRLHFFQISALIHERNQ